MLGVKATNFSVTVISLGGASIPLKMGSEKSVFTENSDPFFSQLLKLFTHAVCALLPLCCLLPLTC